MAADDDDADDSSSSATTAGEVPVVKFPRTRHLMDLGSASRDDLLMDRREADAFLRGDGEIICEEKIDGANLGISLDRATWQLRFQNRAHFVNGQSATQWRGLDAWAAATPGVFDVLTANGDRELVLFGEWVAYRHSIHYTRLPAYFVCFDLYDVAAKRFFSIAERNRRLQDSGIPVVPFIARGRFTKEKLKELATTTRSAFTDGLVEGIYLRRDGPVYNEARCKIVRTNFLASETHWSKATPVKNIVRF